jgi:hypothetical protein
MSYSEHAKATVKVTLTDQDGKVLKVIEGESPDPFGLGFFVAFPIATRGLIPSIPIPDIFGRLHTFDLATPSPSSSLGYLVPGFCLTDCPSAGITPPNGPGIWLYEAAPHTTVYSRWISYTGIGPASFTLITGLTYSSPTVNVSTSTPSSPGDIVYQLYSVSQSITNTLSSPVNVRTVMLVGAIYGSLLVSPIYVPITFYVFDPPVVLSPNVTMTVTVTLSFPVGIAVTPAPSPTAGYPSGTRYAIVVGSPSGSGGFAL